MQKGAIEVVKTLSEKGHIAYFAGGWVRDYLMGHESDDIDIATSALPEDLQEIFLKTIPVGIAFGIVVVVVEGHQYEVATFRRDLDYVDGRHPIGIERCSPEEDAKRRDFTINGMFYDPLQNRIYDYVDGQRDLHLRTIRAIGDADLRFTEDRLRMIRAIRYATRFDFIIDELTKESIIRHSASLLPSVSIERIWQEFSKMAKFNTFGKSLYMLYRFGLLTAIFPALKEVPQNEIVARCKKIEQLPKGLPLVGVMLEICPCTSREVALAMCKFLKLSGKEVKFALALFDARLKFGDKDLASCERFEVAQLLAHPDSEAILTFIGHDYNQQARKVFFADIAEIRASLATHITRLTEGRPLISAVDLQKIGVQNGPLMGELLQMAARISVNEDIARKEDLLESKSFRKLF